jgi:DNA-binding NarL/FixJ family response regulator
VAFIGGRSAGIMGTLHGALRELGPRWTLRVYAHARLALAAPGRDWPPQVIVLEDASAPAESPLQSPCPAWLLAKSAPLLCLAESLDPPRLGGFLTSGAAGCLVHPVSPSALAGAILKVHHGGFALCPTSERVLLDWCRAMHFNPRLEGLTPRERDVVNGILCGLSDKELAVRLGLGTSTVHTHRVKLYRKLGVHTRHELRQCLSGDFACEKSPLRRVHSVS